MDPSQEVGGRCRRVHQLPSAVAPYVRFIMFDTLIVRSPNSGVGWKDIAVGCGSCTNPAFNPGPPAVLKTMARPQFAPGTGTERELSGGVVGETSGELAAALDSSATRTSLCRFLFNSSRR
mmetsp:Transcript_18037/g.45123  ORF Transcript_18037/g.45123 Transcript_18037/m.45123 type:complete len:121 (+) Transcript_18037:322-684(+)